MDIIQRIRVRNKLMFYLILENDLYFFEITEEVCTKYRVRIQWKQKHVCGRED